MLSAFRVILWAACFARVPSWGAHVCCVKKATRRLAPALPMRSLLSVDLIERHQTHSCRAVQHVAALLHEVTLLGMQMMDIPAENVLKLTPGRSGAGSAPIASQSRDAG